MSFSRNRSFLKKVAIVMLFLFVNQIVFPSLSMALTSGPSSPEFSSFEPVATTNMVNDFTGDFTYNIPVINIPGASGSGYALSLSYHSGENVESEASWVGYGWTLNPGAITRTKRGIADDAKDIAITKYNDTPKNWTAQAKVYGAAGELFGFDMGISLSGAIRYNNYKGFGYTAGIETSIFDGVASLGFSVSDGEGSFSVRVNPMAIKDYVNKKNKKTRIKSKLISSLKKKKEVERFSLNKNNLNIKKAKKKAIGGLLSFYADNVLTPNNSLPSFMSPFEGFSVNGTVSLQFSPTPFPAGIEAGLQGSYSSQTNIPKEIYRAYGYLYSGDTNDGDIKDYIVEKESAYNKRDKYLPIPFSMPDQYMVTGEGIGGNFRPHMKYLGHYSPNESESKTQSYQAGVDIEFGVNNAILAFDLGIGYNITGVSDWNSGGNVEDYNFKSIDDDVYDETYFFRFNNDLGGDVNYNTDDKVDDAVLEGFVDIDPKLSGISTQLNSYVDAVPRSGRSSYIGYHTFDELSKTATVASISNVHYYAFDKSSETSTHRSDYVTDSDYADQIGEYAITKEDGSTYVYGLPVFSKNEKSISYGLFGTQPKYDYDESPKYYNVAYPQNTSWNSKVGEEINTPYATSYLVTQILSPNYVDVNLNGADDQDYGGYVKFSYHRQHGGSDWYHWRSPFNGLNFNVGNMTKSEDDMGAFNSGDKEVYYLEEIETNTHIAKFILDTITREDGYEAADDNYALSSNTAKGTGVLRYLERIELYAKTPDAGEELIKTVHFDYDYELCGGTPNSVSTDQKKLTLKKVWFEYMGIKNAKISPYEFYYAYPDVRDYPSEYDYTDEYYLNLFLNPSYQNPGYNSVTLDPWGNYRSDGTDRSRYHKVGVDQDPNYTTFDPAAWQLKRIVLPSGGEIHVQYEQDEYLYVQDRKAMYLSPLDALELQGDGASYCGANKYCIDVSEMGITTLEQKNEYVNIIKQELEGKKIYFKFLYGVVNDNTDMYDGNAMFIDGYVRFKDAGVYTYNNTHKIYIEIDVTDGSKHQTPNKVCHDYGRHNKLGDENPFPASNQINSNNNSSNKKEIIKLLSGLSFTDNKCTYEYINPDYSYFRIPVYKQKKGGGIRVKRLLMYDKGLDTGHDNLYGKEYFYVNENGECSGVASNEPQSMREENPLIEPFIKKDEQADWERITAGRDKDQFEGPWGETMLPGPSVGYSRVIIQDINDTDVQRTKTNNGFVVKTFFTTKDYPYDHVEDGNRFSQAGVLHSKKHIPLSVNAFMLFLSQEDYWASQGYKYIRYNMDGQTKSVHTYAGIFNLDDPAASNYACTAYQIFDYFKPGEKIPMMYGLNDIRMENPGREVDVTMEKRKIHDETNNCNFELDLTITFATGFPVLFATSIPNIQHHSSNYRTHVTTKVVSYPIIQKRIISMQDGIISVSENIGFDPHTGRPLVTKAYDEFDNMSLLNSPSHDGAIVNYQIPAAHKYQGMSQKAINERKIFGAEITSGIITLSSGYCNDFYKDKYLNPGDFVKVIGSTPSPFYDYIKKSGEDYSFENYTPSGPVIIEIIRSGKTNQLTETTGSITAYGSPYHLRGNNPGTSLVDILENLVNETSVTNCTIPPGLIHYYDIENYNCDEPIYLTYDGTGILEFSPCSTSFDAGPGTQFYVNENTGQVYYIDPNAVSDCPVVMDNIELCPLELEALAVSVTTYDYNWPWPNNASLSSTSVLDGTHGKWRPKSSYTYSTSITGGAKPDDTEKIYDDAGVFNFVMFDWMNEVTVNVDWLKITEILKYDNSGNAVEEVDILGIYAAAKYGYSNTKAYLVAANAEYQEVQFESFENRYGTSPSFTFEDDLSVSGDEWSTDYAHAGRYSLKLQNTAFNFKPFALSQDMKENGIIVKTWVRVPKNAIDGIPVSYTLSGSTNGSITQAFDFIARTGEWALYSAFIDVSQYAEGETILVKIQNTAKTKITIYIDDVRLQPANSQMTTYVYDIATHLLLTSFDDQHFGLYYQYNAEGKLIRKLIETKDGLKTVQETQYHNPTVDR
jgi:hypothetical protein